MFKHPTPWFTVPPSLAGVPVQRPLLRWPCRPSMAPAACGTCASQEPLPRPTWPGDVGQLPARHGKTMPCLPSSHHHRFIGYRWDGYCSYHSQSWVVYDIVLPTLVVWYVFFEFAIEKWPSYFVDLPIKDGDFPVRYVKLLEDTFSDGRIPSEEKNPGRYSSPAWRPLTTVLYVCSQEP